jgi:hypothetical protein
MQPIVGSNDDDDDDHDASLLVSPIGSLGDVRTRHYGDEPQQQNAAAVFAVGPGRSPSITTRRTSNYDVMFHNDDNDSMSSLQTPAKSKFNYLEAMTELEYLAPTPAATTTAAATTTEKKKEERSIRLTGIGGEVMLAVDGDVEDNNKSLLMEQQDDDHNHTEEQQSLTSNSFGVETNNSLLMGRRVLFALSSSSSSPHANRAEESSTTCMMEMTNVNNSNRSSHEVAVEQSNDYHDNNSKYSLPTAKDNIGRGNDVPINITNNNQHNVNNVDDVSSFVFRRPDSSEELYSSKDSSSSSSIELKLGHDMTDNCHNSNTRQMDVGDEQKIIRNTDSSINAPLSNVKRREKQLLVESSVSGGLWNQSLDCPAVAHTNSDPSDDDILSTNDNNKNSVVNDDVNVNIESTNNNQVTNKVNHRRPIFIPPLTSVDYNDINIPPPPWDSIDTTDSEETIDDAERSSGNNKKMSTYVDRMNESIDNYFSNRLDLLPEGNDDDDDDGGSSSNSSSNINDDQSIPANTDLNDSINDTHNSGDNSNNSSQIDTTESLESTAYVTSCSQYHQQCHEDVHIDLTNASHDVVVDNSCNKLLQDSLLHTKNTIVAAMNPDPNNITCKLSTTSNNTNDELLRIGINVSNPTVDLICLSTSNDNQVLSDSKNQFIDSMPSNNDATNNLSNSSDGRDVKAPVVASEHSNISVDDDKQYTLSLLDPNAAFRQELKSSLEMPLVADTFEERRGSDSDPLTAVTKQTLPDNNFSPNHIVDLSSGDLLAIDGTGSEPEPSTEGRGKSSIFHVLSHQTDQDRYASETIQTSSIERIAPVDAVAMDQPGHYYNNESLAMDDGLGDCNAALESCKASPEIATQGKRSSLDDLSSYQESFNSTSNEFMERLRHAAESRKREVTRSRYSMERKELALYEEKTVLGDALLSAVEEEVMMELPIRARATPTSSNGRTLRSGSVSSIAIGAKRKTSNAFRSHPSQNYSSHVKKSALNAKPPKRMLSGEDASIAREISHRKLVQKEEERNKHESTFVARPLPMTTHVLSHPLPPLVGENLISVAATSVVQSRNNTNSTTFIPHSSIRAEKRKSYDAARIQRDQQRREADIETRRRKIEQTKREIQDLTKQIR